MFKNRSLKFLLCATLLICSFGVLTNVSYAQDKAPQREDLILFNEVLEFVQKGDLRDGIDHMEKRIEEDASLDVVDVQQTYQLIISAFTRVRNAKETFTQTSNLIEYQIKNVDKEGVISGLAGSCQWLTQTSFRLDESSRNEAIEIVGKAIETVNPKSDYSNTEPPVTQLTQMKAIYAQALLRNGKKDEAKAVCKEEYDALKRLFKNDPDDEVAAAMFVRSVSNLMKMAEGMEEPEQLYTEHQDILNQRMEKDPENASYALQYISALMYKTNSLLTREPAEAESLADEGLALLKKIAEANPALQQNLRQQAVALAKMKAAAQSRITIAKLQDQPAIPFDATGWVNGDETSLEDLKGSVVLLDFWAMWSAPCQKTFPEIRRLHETYSEKGLKIVGVTSYYNYGFDEDTKRPTRSPEPLPEEEQDVAIEAFMASKKLPFTSMVLKLDSKMTQEYGARGIPHMVVIDKQGTIRLLTIGSEAGNFEKIEATIKKLLE